MSQIKYNEPFRINENTLIKFSYPVKTKDFHKIPYSNMGASGNHYVEIDQSIIDSDDNITGFHSRIDNIVWDRGNSVFSHKINYNYQEGYLYRPNLSTVIRNQNHISCELFIKQLFSWDNVYGILISIKGTETNDIYVSKILRINDFAISGNKFMYYGQSWMESNIFYIPSTEESLYIQSTVIKNNELSNLGYIYNYPNEYIPIIQEKPFPDYIITSLSFDSQGFLHIYPKTTENKTLENSIKNYFGYDSDKIINISIQHIISTEGVNINTGLLETKSWRISNEENNFNECVFGIDFSDWFDVDNPSLSFRINVRTEIHVDGKVMNRYSSINTDFYSQIISLKNSIINPVSVIEQNVQEITSVNQTVIQKPVETKLVKIYQPIYVRFIEKDIEYYQSNITFDSLTEHAILIVGDESIQTEVTADGVYYFDLTKITPPESNTEYQIKSIKSDKLIGKGLII